MKIIFSLLLLSSSVFAEEQLELFSSDTQSVQIMQKLADDIGEYFSEDNLSEQGFTYKVLSQNEFSHQLEKLSNKLVEDRQKELSAVNAEVYSTTIYAVYRNGVVVGYIISINDSYDNEPLWDGSGVTHYISVQMAVVESVEWVG